MTTTNEDSLYATEKALNLFLEDCNFHTHTRIEWDCEIGQWFLSVDKTDFGRFEAIKALLKAEGFNIDEFINGHGFIRPVSIGRRLDLALPYWTYSLWR